MTQDNTTDLAVQPKATYSLSIEGAGLKLERTLDEATAFRVLAVVMGGSEVAGLSTPSLGAVGPRGRLAALGSENVTVGEFIEESGATTNTDKIAAIAVYLQRYSAVETFTKSDIQSQFQAAREAVPANLTRDLNKAVTSRYLSDRGNGTFSITNTGFRAVDQRFSAEARRVPSSRRRARRKSPATEAQGE